MTHDDLCPKRAGWWKKCRCELILEVRSNQRKADRSDSGEIHAIWKKWYWSGRQDAAELLEDLMHHPSCNCDSCSVLAASYSAILKGQPIK